MKAGAAQIQIKAPTLLTGRVIVTLCLWGLLLMLPVLLSMMVVSVLQLGIGTFLIPLATIAGVTFFLPLGFGNPYVARLIRPLHPSRDHPEDVFLVQLTRKPRSRSGLLAVLEDADDIGFLSLGDKTLIFAGDSIRLLAPYDQLKELQLLNAGWRALFAYGPRTTFSLAALPEAGSFSFAERSSWHLPGSRRKARQIYQRLSERVRAVESSVASEEPDRRAS